MLRLSFMRHVGGDLMRPWTMVAHNPVRCYAQDHVAPESSSSESPSGLRAESVKKLISELGFNPLQDLYGLKSMPTSTRKKLLQKTLFEEELKRRREIDFPQLKARAVPWTPPTTSRPFQVSYSTYVFAGSDQTFPRGWKVKATAKISDLVKEYSLDETATKKIKLIAGPRYYPEIDSIKIVCKHRPSKAENLERIEKMFARLIVAAKDKTETFNDVTVEAVVSLFGRTPKKTVPVYPESWKIPQKPKTAQSAR